jgi:RNA polymerase sigma factor (sigma-70 family)
MLAPDCDAAEDACQAAFVALAIHATRLRERNSLAAWLHRVAVRASLDLIAQRRISKPLTSECADPPDRQPDPVSEASRREVRTLLDAALNRLPDKLRLPFVMCELEGLSNADAARALGCPVGTVESRLTRARHKLREWLTQRGVVPGVAAIAVALPETTRAAMVRTGVVGAELTPAVRALAARAIPSVAVAKLRLLVALGLVLLASAVGFGLSAGEAPKPGNNPFAKITEPTRLAPEAREKEANEAKLPEGVIARLGSPRLRHPAWVKDVCFSLDGKRLASVGHDNAVRVWDAETGVHLFAVRRQDGTFDKVSFASDGKVVITLGFDQKKVGELWRIAANGNVIDKLPLGIDQVVQYGARFSTDGSRLAVADVKGKRLAVFDTTTGKVVWEKRLPDDTPGGVAFSADGKTVAMSTSGGRVELFDADGKPAGTLKSENAKLTTVALSPDGSVVTSRNGNSPSCELIAWDRATGKIMWTQQHKGEHGLTFTPDAKTIVQCTTGFAACTIDASDGIPPGLSGKMGAYFESMVEAQCLSLRPDGKEVAFGNISGVICLFDVTTGKPVNPTADPPYEVRWMRFSADGKTLYGWAADWYSWDIATGKQSRVTNSGWNYGVPLSPDGKFTARSVWYSGYRRVDAPDDGTRFEICDAKTGEIVHSHRGKRFQGLGWREFTPDGKAVAISYHDGTIGVYAIDTGKELVRMTGHKEMPQYRAFSADGRVLVTATLNDPLEEFSVRVWDLKTGKELAKLNPGVGVCGVAASADGRRVAALAYTNSAGKPDPRQQATVWDVTSAKVLARVAQNGEGGEISLSPDGRLVAVSARWKGDVQVYEVASGTERFVFKHEGEITGLIFAPDGRTLVAASKEAPIYVWDIAGKFGERPPAWDASATAKVWSGLGAKDAVQAFATIRLLRANPDKAVAFLKERAKLPATPDAHMLEKLLADLGSDDFATREKAMATLTECGEAVRFWLREEAAASSPEVRKRIGELLTRLDAPTPARLRLLRAAEVLEQLGTPEAKALLEAWVDGSAGATLAGEAKIALARLAAGR